MIKRKLKSLLLKRQIRLCEAGYENAFYNELYTRCAIKKLSSAQIHEIDSYYKNNFGRKISTMCHEYYYSMTGQFSVHLMPDTLFYPHIRPYFNDMTMERAYSDKNNYDLLFPDVVLPRPIVKNMNGHYYQNNIPITEAEAVSICSDLDAAIIKPALDTCRGQNVLRWASAGGKTDVESYSVLELLRLYDSNFIIQEALKQHPVLASLNASSINTVRVITVRRGNDVVALSSVVRIGRDGAIVDNGHAGGYCCGIKEGGRLKEAGYICQSGECRTETDNGTKLGDVQIPYFDEITKLAKELHLKLPYINFIGWDFSINDRNEIVLIEFNHCPSIDIMQLCNGPILGDYTDEILKTVARNNYKWTADYILQK